MARGQSQRPARPRLVPLAATVAITLSFAGAACADEPEGPLTLPDSQLEPIKWTEIDGWAKDDQLAAFNTFQVSCQLIRKTKQPKDARPLYAAIAEVCQRAANVKPANAKAARAFFEQNFRPVRINRLGEAQGFLTGYFEPIVRGSRFPSPEFHVPLYRRPPDLVAVGYKGGLDNFPNKGVQVGRFNESNELVPYYDRGEIEEGALDGRKLEICWLRDPFEALSISIQGSARVILEDGTPLRVNYDSHNGHPYTSIGRILIERNLVPREEMSMQRIRDWMAANRDEAPKMRATNRSYVFFRITGLSNDGEPIGGQGVPLTPVRSIAVDKIHVYGTPFFIEANLPIDSAKPVTPFHKLMIAQDTGSAIVGPARADLYWGAGDDAGRIAGRLRHPGKFVMLLPRELDLVAAGRQMPLPVAKPKIFEDQPNTEAKKGGDGVAARAKPEEMPKEAPKTSEKSRPEVAKPEPVKPEPAKTIAKPDLAKSDVTKSDVTKPDVSRANSTKSDAAKSDAIKTDPGKVNPAKVDAANTDSAKTAAVKPEAAKSDAAKPDSAKPDSAKSPAKPAATAKSEDHGKTSRRPRRQAAPTQWWWRPW